MDDDRVTREDIAKGFRALGVEPGQVILLHSSLKSFGRVEGGADAVIDGILDAVGRYGTLVVPTLTGHRDLSPENPPHIDLEKTPCWNGLIPETLRKRPNAIRSVHPTHSCAAIGDCARAVTQDHHVSPTPCGTTSPYLRVALAGGLIAFAGCGLDRCTTCHTVEELGNVPYHLQDRVAMGVCIDKYERTIQTPVRLHSYNGPERNFPILEPLLLERGLMRIGTVGKSTVRIVDAMGLINTALEKVRKDPYYLTVLRTKD